MKGLTTICRQALRASAFAAALLVSAAGCGSGQPGAAARTPSADGGGALTDSGTDAAHSDAAPSDASAAPVSDASAPKSDATAVPPGDASAPTDAAGAPQCKRGIASNTAPSGAFVASASSPGIAWWYNWAAQGSGSGTDFVPMIWGAASLQATIPAGSKYLLGFNEPNFKAQSNLTVAQAVADWPQVEAAAQTTGAGAAIVSPAVNFCGSTSDPSQCADPAVTDPYTYLRDFFASCSACKVDYIAVHWYNCDLPSLKAYLEGNVDAGGGLQGFVQFGKPIWLTEFACDSSHSAADQKAYMEAAVPYLEANPNVFRYSWFSASPIPNAELANADGSLTDLGATYVALPATCR
jgi:hypothetical protein